MVFTHDTSAVFVASCGGKSSWMRSPVVATCFRFSKQGACSGLVASAVFLIVVYRKIFTVVSNNPGTRRFGSCHLRFRRSWEESLESVLKKPWTCLHTYANISYGYELSPYFWNRLSSIAEVLPLATVVGLARKYFSVPDVTVLFFKFAAQRETISKSDLSAFS